MFSFVYTSISMISEMIWPLLSEAMCPAGENTLLLVAEEEKIGRNFLVSLLRPLQTFYCFIAADILVILVQTLVDLNTFHEQAIQ